MFTIEKPYHIDRRLIPLKTILESRSILDKIDTQQIINIRGDYHRIKQWNTQKREQFIDSLLRLAYIPSLVFREIKQNNQCTWEILDGWQRIKAIRDFTDSESKNRIQVPITLRNIPQFSCVIPNVNDPNVNTLPNLYYSQLPHEIGEYIKNIELEAHIIQNINTYNSEHQKIAKQIFLTLQDNDY